MNEPSAEDKHLDGASFDPERDEFERWLAQSLLSEYTWNEAHRCYSHFACQFAWEAWQAARAAASSLKEPLILPARPCKPTAKLDAATATLEEGLKHFMRTRDYWAEEAKWQARRADALHSRLTALLLPHEPTSSKANAHLPGLEWSVTYAVEAYDESYGGYGYDASRENFSSAEEAIAYAKSLQSFLRPIVWQRTTPKPVRPLSVKVWSFNPND